jgi:hypothetical protein
MSLIFLVSSGMRKCFVCDSCTRVKRSKSTALDHRGDMKYGSPCDERL